MHRIRAWHVVLALLPLVIWLCVDSALHVIEHIQDRDPQVQVRGRMRPAGDAQSTRAWMILRALFALAGWAWAMRWALRRRRAATP